MQCYSIMVQKVMNDGSVKRYTKIMCPHALLLQAWSHTYVCICAYVLGSMNVQYIIVTGFAKRGLPHTSTLPTLTIHNFRLETVIALKFSE